MIPQHLQAVLDLFAKDGERSNWLIISRTEPSMPVGRLFPKDATVQWLCHVYSADDLVAVARADLGVVFDQLEHMEDDEGVHLLSRLRDRYCRRVLLHLSDAMHTDKELLGLGYIRQQSAPADGRLYLFDPKLFFEKREWNSPDKWANPENFEKFRW